MATQRGQFTIKFNIIYEYDDVTHQLDPGQTKVQPVEINGQPPQIFDDSAKARHKDIDPLIVAQIGLLHGTTCAWVYDPILKRRVYRCW